MPAKRSRRQIERLKKARGAKSGRFVVIHTKSGSIHSVVRGRSSGRALPKARTYGATTIVREHGSDDGSRHPRPRVPLLSADGAPGLAGGAEESFIDPDVRGGREADNVAGHAEERGFSGRPKILDLLGAGGLDEEQAREYALEVVRIARRGSRAPEAPAPSPEAVRERREARQHRDG